MVDGKKIIYSHCPTFAKFGECHKKCVLRALHGRNHDGTPVGRDFAGNRAKKTIAADDVPASVKRTIEKHFVDRLNASMTSSTAPNARISELSPTPETVSSSFKEILDQAMTQTDERSD